MEKFTIRGLENREKVYQIIKASEDPISCYDIAKKIKGELSNQAISNHCRKLLEEGKIRLVNEIPENSPMPKKLYEVT